MNERTGTCWMLNAPGTQSTANLLQGADIGQAVNWLAERHPDLSPERAAEASERMPHDRCDVSRVGRDQTPGFIP
ncbi:hypothetical protein ACFQ08_00035 [Streptosporangium algeriense]|uniref:Uncharacterized protein n=1 Tax=Streptosporangium algeriense TaxID=1682748 RepID=A0ABW3DIE4_9ACTN